MAIFLLLLVICWAISLVMDGIHINKLSKQVDILELLLNGYAGISDKIYRKYRLAKEEGQDQTFQIKIDVLQSGECKITEIHTEE